MSAHGRAASIFKSSLFYQYRVEILLEFGKFPYTNGGRFPIFNFVRFPENIFQTSHVALNAKSLRDTTMKKRNSCESGFSLIEVIIAAAIFSTGLGGLSLLLLTAVMGTAEAGHQTFASTRATSLAEMIAMNSAATGHYINPLLQAEPCMVGENCSGEQLASADINQWLVELARELPRGSGLVCRDSTPEDGHSANIIYKTLKITLSFEIAFFVPCSVTYIS